MSDESDRNYSLDAGDLGVRIAAPDLPYRPQDPKRYRPRIGLVGCGGITKDHLTAYRQAGYDVAAMCDVVRDRAERQRRDFYPEADVYEDYRELLRRDDIEVVDLAAHARQREPIIEAALDAGKHVLSQKPFVVDLDFGRRMVELAERQGVRLAVNQNGRWAPHFSYAREAIRAGLIGEVSAVHLSVHWDHGWVKGTDFENIRHLILYDFGIHWFDMVRCFLGGRQPRRVFASTARSPDQQIAVPLLAQAAIEYDDAQASLAFDASTGFGAQDRSYVVGGRGTIHSIGPDLKHQTLTLHTPEGHAVPELAGCWFPDGFHGTMGELLSAIEEGREPSNSARDNLESLALCFAAAASADRGEPVAPGTVRRMEE